MAIDSISSIDPAIAVAQPTASAISAESRVYAPGNADTDNVQADSTPVSPVALDVEATIREASAQISRVSQPEGPMPVDIGAAAQSYTAESEAQNQVVVQQQNDSTPVLNVLA
jgi:hypothetical protein